MEGNEVKEETFIPKTKHKFLKILLAILIVAGLGVGAYFLYQKKFNDPKSIVSHILETASNSDLVINKEAGKYKVNGIVKIDANLGEEDAKVTEILKDIEYQFSGEVDLKDSIANLDVNTKYKDEKLLDFKAYLENNIYYVLLDGIYDKYLIINDNKEDSSSVMETVKDISLNSKDLNVIIKALRNAFKDEILKLDFVKENATIKVDGKDIDVYNNYVVLKDNEVNKLASAILTNMANDSEVTKIVKDLSGEDGKVVLTVLASELEKTPFTGLYRINFYTDKSIFNKKLVSLRQDIVQSGITTSFNIDKIDDGAIISANVMGISLSVKVKKNSSNYNVNLSLNMIEQYINLDISVNYEKINSITKPDVSKSKKIDDLTEDEKKQIEENLAKNKALEELYKKIEKATNKNEV